MFFPEKLQSCEKALRGDLDDVSQLGAGAEAGRVPMCQLQSQHARPQQLQHVLLRQAGTRGQLPQVPHALGCRQPCSQPAGVRTSSSEGSRHHCLKKYGSAMASQYSTEVDIVLHHHLLCCKECVSHKQPESAHTPASAFLGTH